MHTLNKLTAFILGAFFLTLGFTGASHANAAVSKKVIGNIVFWDQARGYQDIQDNVNSLSEVSPLWYNLNSQGDVLPYLDANGRSYIDPVIISYLRAQNILITPTISNAINGVWDPLKVSQIINDPILRTTHVNNLVRTVVDNGYDGMSIDYEELAASDRSAFSAFISELAAGLHQQGKTLAVYVYPKTAEPGNWGGPQSQDFVSISNSADQVRIMAYGYSWGTSAPGPLAPVNWVNDVLAFSVTEIPKSKLIYGVPTYGIDWPAQSSGTERMWSDFIVLAQTYNAILNHSALKVQRLECGE